MTILIDGEDLEQLKKNAARYMILRDHVAPTYLTDRRFPSLGSLPKGGPINKLIDRMIDGYKP